MHADLEDLLQGAGDTAGHRFTDCSTSQPTGRTLMLQAPSQLSQKTSGPVKKPERQHDRMFQKSELGEVGSAGSAVSSEETLQPDLRPAVAPATAPASAPASAPATPVFGVGSRPRSRPRRPAGASCIAPSQEMQESDCENCEGFQNVRVSGESPGTPRCKGWYLDGDGQKSMGLGTNAKPGMPASLGRRNREVAMSFELPFQSAPSKSFASSPRQGQKPPRKQPARYAQQAPKSVRAVERALRAQLRYLLRWCLAAWQKETLQNSPIPAESFDRFDCDRMDETADKVLEHWHTRRECQFARPELSYRLLTDQLQGECEKLAAELATAHAEVADARLAEAETAQAEMAVLRAVRAEVVSERQAERATYREESAQFSNASSELAELKAAVEQLELERFQNQRSQPEVSSMLEELEASEMQSAQRRQESNQWAEHCSALSDELHVQSIICRRLELDKRHLSEENLEDAQREKERFELLEHAEMQEMQQLRHEVEQLKRHEEGHCQELSHMHHALAEARLECSLVESRAELQSQLNDAPSMKAAHDRPTEFAKQGPLHRLRWWVRLPRFLSELRAGITAEGLGPSTCCRGRRSSFPQACARMLYTRKLQSSGCKCVIKSVDCVRCYPDILDIR